MTKKYLDDRKVEYSTVDITQDSEALDKIINQGFKAAPVVNAGSQWWSGFQPDLIDKHIVN
jgi:glutaredoxin-like protein NrdH